MSPISVLLVDDNPIFLRLTTRLLREHYYDEVVVVGASSGGEDALAKARDLRPQIVLLGLGASGLPGLEAIPVCGPPFLTWPLSL